MGDLNQASALSWQIDRRQSTHSSTWGKPDSVHPFLREVPSESVHMVFDHVVLISLVEHSLDQTVSELRDGISSRTRVRLLVEMLCELFGWFRLSDGT